MEIEIFPFLLAIVKYKQQDFEILKASSLKENIEH